MRRSLTTLLASAVLALGLLPAAAGAAPGTARTDDASAPGGPGASAPASSAPASSAPADDLGGTADREAKVALGTAQRVIAGDARAADPSPSIALRELFMRLPALEGRQRRSADAVLARPTDGNRDRNGDGYDRPSTKRCSDHFCLHWVTSGDDAPPGAGSGGSWTDTNLAVLEEAWDHHVRRLGFRAPLADGRRGGDGKLDVYLSNVGPKGYYGYCTTERRPYPRRNLASGYCVLDDDFRGFGAPPQDILRVTAAHEFFHTIQYAYDYTEDRWLMEATATWVEERFADSINDNRQYLRAGQVARPGTPLDYYSVGSAAQYGNWGFFEFLSQRLGHGIVRDIWNRLGDFGNAPDQYSIQGVRTAVSARRRSFAGMYAQFAAANTAPRLSYEEGGAWPRARTAGTYRLSPSRRGTGKIVRRLNHLTARSVDVVRGEAFRGNWHLLVRVNGPHRAQAPGAVAQWHQKNGTMKRRVLRLNRRGDTQLRVPFNSAVRRVTLTVSNASTRYRCGRNTGWSCGGVPLDDRRPFVVRAYSVRPR